MIIRCKRCFKKYDDIDSECPRCGKINDRDFNKKAKNYTKRDKIDTDVLENISKLIISKTMNMSKLFIRKFMNPDNCEFCGADSNISFGQCPVCMNSKLSKLIDEETDNFPDRNILFEATESVLDSSEKVVDLEDFKNELKDNGYNFENWKAAYEGQFGIIYNLITLIVTFNGIAMLVLLFLNKDIGSVLSAVILNLLVLIVGNVIVLLLSKRRFSEKIVFLHSSYQDTYEISLLKKVDRQGYVTIYEIKTSDVKYLEMEVDITTNELKSIVITANNDSDINQPKYKIDVSDYYNNKGLKLGLLFICLINNINTYILKTSEVIEEVLETPKEDLLFVRIDTQIEGQVLTEEEYNAHLSYLEKISSERYFKGGSFIDSGGMIVFSADNFTTADDISKNDPIIQNNKYSYQLKQWKVLLESE